MDKKEMLAKLGGNLISHEIGLREDLMSYQKGKYAYVMAKNGIFKVYRQDAILNCDLLAPTKENTSIPLIEEITQPYQYLLPKIPFEIYINVLDFFKTVYDKDKTEASVMVYYNLYSEGEIEIPSHLQELADKGLDIVGKWYVYAPVQRNSGALTDFKDDELDAYLREKTCKVIEIHSHHTMDAFWSSTDNANQKENMFYGVFGKINTEDKFLLKAVANNGKIYDKLDVTELFEFPHIKIKTNTSIQDSEKFGDVLDTSEGEEEILVKYEGAFKRLNNFKSTWLEQHTPQKYTAPLTQYGKGYTGKSNTGKGAWYDEPFVNPSYRDKNLPSPNRHRERFLDEEEIFGMDFDNENSLVDLTDVSNDINDTFKMSIGDYVANKFNHKKS